MVDASSPDAPIDAHRGPDSTGLGGVAPSPEADDADLILRRAGGGERILLRLRSGPMRAALNAMLVLVIIGGFGIVAHAVSFAYAKMYVFPYWDMGGLQHRFFNAPLLDFLLFRDNEHLPILAMPLFAADNLLFSARGVSLITLILALSAAMAALLTDEIRRACGRADLGLAAVAALLAAGFFWLIHWENLIWPKQIHMYLAAVLILLAARYTAVLDLRFRRAGSLSASAVGLLGLMLVAATFSFGYGAVGWLIVVIVAVTGRWPIRAMRLFALLFALTAVGYALRYNVATLEHHSNPLDSLGDPLGLARYAAHYLAYPIVALLESAFRVGPAKIVGVMLTVCASLFAAWLMFRWLVADRARSGRAELIGAFLMLFACGAALMTALSRLKFGDDQALSSRYAIVQILFWLGLILGLAPALRDRPWLRRAGLGFGGILLLVWLIPSHYIFSGIASDRFRTHWQSVLAVVNGVSDSTVILQNLHPSGPLIENVARNLSARRWSIYADPQPHWLGQSAATLFRRNTEEVCRGSFDIASDLSRLQDQAYVEGWAWDVRSGRPPIWVVIIDDQDRVRGLARTGWERPDVAAAVPETRGGQVGWRGYVAAPTPLSGMEAYAVMSDGASICRLTRNVKPSGPRGHRG